MRPLPNNGTFARMHTREEPHSSKKLLKAARNLNQGGNSYHAAEEDTGGVSNRPGNVLLGAPQAVHNPQSAVNSANQRLNPVTLTGGILRGNICGDTILRCPIRVKPRK